MTTYQVTVPTFSDLTRIEFTVTLNSLLYTFEAEWWDNLWHLVITREGLKRTCTLYPNATYFKGDTQYVLQWSTEETTVGLTSLSGATFLVAVDD